MPPGKFTYCKTRMVAVGSISPNWITPGQWFSAFIMTIHVKLSPIQDGYSDLLGVRRFKNLSNQSISPQYINIYVHFTRLYFNIITERNLIGMYRKTCLCTSSRLRYGFLREVVWALTWTQNISWTVKLKYPLCTDTFNCVYTICFIYTVFVFIIPWIPSWDPRRLKE